MFRPRFKGRLHRVRRYRHIVAVLMKYGLEEVAHGVRTRLADRFGKARAPTVERAAVGHSRPARVRMALEEMGPTFVKFGQLLSTRADLVSQEYIAELEKLQDQVKPEDPDRICAAIERELGAGIMDLFKDFECTPLAAGSIAQVHRAWLKDGTAVVVKVRRPGIVEVIAAECEIFRELAGILQTTVLDNQGLDYHQMAQDLTSAVLKETDLANERRNQLRFLQGFAQDPTVHVPRVYESHCAEAVLTMEFIDGIKPSPVEALRLHGLDPKVVAQRGADFVLRQIFDMGFFHADPHPGNFFVLPGNVLAPIDFGQVATLPSQDRALFTEILLAVVGNEARRIVSALDRADMLGEDTDSSRLCGEIELLIEAYRHLPLREIPFGQAMNRLFDLFRTHHVRPPAHIALMLKSLVTIEAFAKSLNPDFNIVETLTPYARKWAMSDLQPKRLWDHLRQGVRHLGDFTWQFPEDANAVLRKLRQGKAQIRIHHEHLEYLTKTLDKSSNRISFSLIIAALLVASSLLVPQEGKALGFISLQTLGIAGYIFAAIIGIWLLVSILRSGRL
ncbi:MAG: hypothetical protein KBE04_09855 [Phycisphaerae bacterium]|nr:hypothetical protein [Phycisphaerae bacterium]